ncbi:MAG TPA: CinA family nicotinamide mononucleotide deamidase-related protein [Opitutaceae bacterium]|jgi:nicotinamide-nucleotide amidase|nr:CinA family nicotinamide mononucleotide deamidase-related protein [Opitutaceae bacterium]
MLSVSHASFAAKRFELLTLGDELLLGLTTNGHLAFIGAQLGRRGVTLQRNVTLTDGADAIAAQFRESWARSDVVITTGGLGPTCDDRTRETIAEVLGQKLVFDPAVEKVITERFALHGRKMPPNNLRQAYRPERAEVLANANGTAPGLWIEQDGKVLCLLPGPPNELQPMFTEQVLPRLARLGLLLDHEAYVQIRTAGIGESALEAKLQPIFDRHGDALGVAFCAHTGHVDCRLSSPGEKLPFNQLQDIADDCARLLREDFVCFGHDSLAKVCADILRAQEKMLAVAEATTGGLLANAFTDICGAAKFFAGGCVCCANDAKTQLLDVPECLLLQHGAVSAETAVAMATGAAEKLGADYAVAITGFAGPCGGTKENPIGTIYLALHAPHGVWSKKLSYPGPRRTVQERAVNAALDWLRRELVRAQAGLVAATPRLGVPQ